jgi:hypothetical protein
LESTERGENGFGSTGIGGEVIDLTKDQEEEDNDFIGKGQPQQGILAEAIFLARKEANLLQQIDLADKQIESQKNELTKIIKTHQDDVLGHNEDQAERVDYWTNKLKITGQMLTATHQQMVTTPEYKACKNDTYGNELPDDVARETP